MTFSFLGDCSENFSVQELKSIFTYQTPQYVQRPTLQELGVWVIRTDNQLSLNEIEKLSIQLESDISRGQDTSFELSIEQITNLIKTADSIVSYPKGSQWEGYPRRVGDEDIVWDSGFTKDLKDSKYQENDEQGSYVRKIRKGGINYEDAQLIIKQLEWARQSDPTNARVYISARNFLFFLFQGNVYGENAGMIASGFDHNNDGIFDLTDVERLPQVNGKVTFKSCMKSYLAVEAA